MQEQRELGEREREKKPPQNAKEDRISFGVMDWEQKSVFHTEEQNSRQETCGIKIKTAQ